MKDITIVHDQVGCYSYWLYSTFHEGIQEPWLTRYWHDYLEGKRPPNYPVPAIRQPAGKIHALSAGCWRWYWYLSGFNYDR